jgi:hypothetical protein
MLATGYQVVDVLMLVGNVAPVALYFLTLGLVNSHSRPYLTSSRSDFLALTVVLVPLLLWPLPSLAGLHAWWPLAGGIALAAALFVRMLPGRGAGFVVYNISENTCQRSLEQSLSELGLRGQWEGRSWRSDCGRLAVQLRKFALLRNVSINLELRDQSDQRLTADLQRSLTARLDRVAQLPSTMGASLVLLGVFLLILPMWMVGRHIQDLVEAMSHLFG